MSRIVSHALCIATATALISCSGSQRFDPNNLDLSRINATDSMKLHVLQAWPKLLRACPGIITYSDDLSLAGISSTYREIGAGPAHIDVDVVLRITDRPGSIPVDFRADRHNCYFSINPDGDSVLIGKSACVAVCTESRAEKSFLSLPLQ